MSFYEIPLSAIPHQLVSVVIDDKAYEIEVRQCGSSLFVSVTIDGEQITSAVRAVNRGSITPWADYRVGTEIVWVDTQGDADPQYDGLGTRWRLVYGADE